VTPDNRNNEPLDAILRRSMRAQPGPATPECADAESLAAYSDRSLSASERERLETHFADCMRCQLMLADIARADESARDAKTASEVPWYRRWRIAIPALAAVAAVLVFIAIRRPANEEPQRDQLVAMAKQEAPPMEVAEQAAPPAPAPAPQAAAPAAQIATLASRPAASVPKELARNEVRPEVTAKHQALRTHHAAQAPAPASPAAAPTPPPVDAGRVVAIAPAAPVVESSSSAVGRPTASVSSELAMNQPQSAPQRAESSGYAAREQLGKAAAPGIGAMVAAPAAGAPAIAGAAVSRGAAIGGTTLGAGSGAIAGGAAVGAAAGAIVGSSSGAMSAPSAPVSGAATGAAAAIGGAQTQMAETGSYAARSVGGASGGAEVLVTTMSPDRSVTWIFGQNGMLRRHDADIPGSRMQHSGVSTDLVAGSAPSATVCWIVGRSGTIIRTIDGEHWELITAPSADNLGRVSATSARDATITTAGGQSFTTSDGGATWHSK
jgi:hypothetical protein